MSSRTFIKIKIKPQYDSKFLENIKSLNYKDKEIIVFDRLFNNKFSNKDEEYFDKHLSKIAKSDPLFEAEGWAEMDTGMFCYFFVKNGIVDIYAAYIDMYDGEYNSLIFNNIIFKYLKLEKVTEIESEVDYKYHASSDDSKYEFIADSVEELKIKIKSEIISKMDVVDINEEVIHIEAFDPKK